MADEKKKSESAKEQKGKNPAAEAKAPEQSATPEKVRVKSRVNMSCYDGTHLEIGKHADLSAAEYDRLKKDPRGPFFEE
jgi:hypothetical protein